MKNDLNSLYDTIKPVGGRISTPHLRRMNELAQQYSGLPDGINIYGILHLLKRVGRQLNFTNSQISHLEYLINHTKPIDWEDGQQPIVFKSVNRMAMERGVSERQINFIENKLHKLGALTWTDTGNHKRSGFRDASGKIHAASGVNLAPLAYLYEKLVLENDKKIQHEKLWLETKRQISFYRKKILATGREILASCPNPEDFLSQKDLDVIICRLRATTSITRLLATLKKLKCLDHEFDTFLMNNQSTSKISSDVVDITPGRLKTSPLAEENIRHKYNTIQVDSSKDDLGKREDAPKLPIEGLSEMQKLFGSASRRKGDGAARSFSRVLGEVNSTPSQDISVGMEHVRLENVLAALSSNAKSYVAVQHGSVTWASLVDAADYLCFDLHIPRYLWIEACALMGRNAAAICVIILDRNQKHPKHPVVSPAGAFRGMIKKVTKGELKLHQSLFGILSRSCVGNENM